MSLCLRRSARHTDRPCRRILTVRRRPTEPSRFPEALTTSGTPEWPAWARDEGTLRALGADERTAYGKTLLTLVPVCDKPQNPLLGATTMTSGKRSLKERITRIAENRQAKAAAVFAVVALAALVCAVSFTGSSRPLSAVCGDFWDAEATCTYVEERPDVDARYTPADGTVRLSEHLALVRIGSAHPKKTVAVNPAWSTLYLTLPDADGGTAEPLTINFIREYDAPGSTEAVYTLNIGTRDAAKSYKVLSGQDEIDAFLAYLRGEASPEQISHPAFPNNLTEAERSVVDEFLHWAQALRAEDILNLRFQSGSGSRFLVDAELTALSAQLVPALNALTEAELYTQRGYGDSAYYTLTVNMRDGTQYTFLCGFDCVRLLHPTFEPGLSSSYPSDRPTLWIDSPALMACINTLHSPSAPLPDFETAAPTPLADILPAREPWMTIPLAGKAQRIADRRIPSDALDWLTQMDMDGDGVCEIVNSSDFPAIYYKRGGELYGVDLKSVITAAWPELNWWDYTSAAPASRSLLFCGLSAGDAPGDGVNFTRYLYFDGESLLLYKPDRSHTDHVADATLADPSVPAEVAARAKQLVRQRYDTLAGSAAQYDDWYTDVSFLGAETRYEGLTLEVYSFSQHYHAQKPEKILLAGGTEVDEDGWAILDGDTVLDGPYYVAKPGSQIVARASSSSGDTGQSRAVRRRTQTSPSSVRTADATLAHYHHKSRKDPARGRQRRGTAGPFWTATRSERRVKQRLGSGDTLAGRAAQYDDWYTDVSFLGAETRYAGLTLEVYSFSQHYHAQKPEKILLAGGTEVDEDGWAILDGDTVLDGPYIVCLMDGGTRRMLEGSMSGDCSTGSPAYYSDLTALLAKNNVLRPDALDGGRLKEAMSSGISFLNWLGQYDAAEQDRALERLSAYRASLTDSYDLDMFSRIVAYLLGDRDGLTDAGRAAQERFRAKFG